MIKHVTFLIIISFVSLSLEAQTYRETKWLAGRVELNNGITYKGDIQYDYRTNTLIIRTAKGEKTFTAGDVYTFYLNRVYEDGELVFPEKFYFSVYEPNELGIMEPSFYRVLVGGEVSLLTKGKLDHTYAGFEFPQFYIRNEPFLLFRDGRIEKLSIWRKRMLEQLGGDKDKMLAYIKQEKLDLRTANGLVKLVRYFNESRDS